jgi:hypothetical protein
MNIPKFTAQASLYRASNSYHSSVAESGGSIPAPSVVAAYIPGPKTQNRCSGCIDVCTATRDVCLAKVAITVAETCWASLGFGCGAAIALGYIQAASCESTYLSCFGICNIPSASGLGWESPCCPKVCGFPTPGSEGTGCCDHGEACVDQDDPNSREGCCPSGRLVCGNSCCAEGQTFCTEGGQCSSDFPGHFPNDPPPPPPPNNCIFGGEPCGPKCCPPGLQCCNYSPQFGPDCKTSCIH